MRLFAHFSWQLDAEEAFRSAKRNTTAHPVHRALACLPHSGKCRAVDLPKHYGNSGSLLGGLPRALLGRGVRLQARAEGWAQGYRSSLVPAVLYTRVSVVNIDKTTVVLERGKWCSLFTFWSIFLKESSNWSKILCYI